MSAPEGFLGKTLLDLRDENKNQVGSVSLPAINDDFPSDRELLHFINPIIEPGQGKFRWVIRDEAYDLMGPLAKTGIDELAFFPRRARGRVDLIRIVLHVPKSCPNVVMIPKAQGQQGRAMTEKELAEFEERPFDFYSIGWIGEQVQTTDSFGVDVRK